MRRFLLAASSFVLATAACGPKSEKAAAPAAPVAPPVSTATPVATPAAETAPAGVSRATVTVTRIPWPGEGTAGAILDIAAVAPGEAIAVGQAGVLRIAGGAVEVTPLPSGIATSVWADGADFAVVVGYGGISYARERDGAWTPLPTGTDADLLAVWGRGSGASRQVFAGGTRGTVLELRDGAWAKVPAPEPVHVNGFAGNAESLWAIGELGGGNGEGAILEWNGNAFLDACPQLACGSAVYDGWAPVAGELWTAGARGELVRYAGLHPEWISTAVREDLTGVWGTGTSDVFVIGDAGTCLRFDGTAWAPLPLGTTDDLRAISGLPSGEAWIAGAGGSLLHIAATPGG